MFDLETIKFLNQKKPVARAHCAAQSLNAGSVGHAKSGEKTGAPATREDWITDGEWEARKRRRKKRKPAY